MNDIGLLRDPFVVSPKQTPRIGRISDVVRSERGPDFVA